MSTIQRKLPNRSCIYFDFDIKKTLDEVDSDSHRLYTDHHIVKIIEYLNKIIPEKVELRENHIRHFVCEKE